MPLVAYICPAQHFVRVEGEDPLNAVRCPQCAARIGYTGGAYIHASEKVTVLRNAAGEVRIPGTPDSPMAQKYLENGFVRETLDSHSDIRALERTQGIRHERSYFDRNSAAADRYYQGEAPAKRTQPVGIVGRDGQLKIIRPQN